ncbi:hypothetical protein ACLOJK_034241 [Asimina triloba]
MRSGLPPHPMWTQYEDTRKLLLEKGKGWDMWRPESEPCVRDALEMIFSLGSLALGFVDLGMMLARWAIRSWTVRDGWLPSPSSGTRSAVLDGFCFDAENRGWTAELASGSCWSLPPLEMGRAADVVEIGSCRIPASDAA